MTRRTTTRTALLGACLALPLAAWGGTAFAAQTHGARTITLPPGTVILILPAAAATVATPPFTKPATQIANDPMLQLIAQQDAMMQGMMTEMNAAFTQPMLPQMDQMIQAAMHGAPLPADAGNGMVFTSVSNGPGVCTERMEYQYPANGGKPQVTMSHSGNACGTLGVGGPMQVEQATPVSPRSSPPSASHPGATPLAPSHGPRMWTVSDPPQRIIRQGAPRT